MLHSQNRCITSTRYGLTSEIKQYIEQVSREDMVFGWAVQAGSRFDQSNKSCSSKDGISDSKYIKLWTKFLQKKKSVVVMGENNCKFYMIPVDFLNEKWCNSYLDISFPYGSYLVFFMSWGLQVEVPQTELLEEDASLPNEQDLLFNSLVQSVEQGNINLWTQTAGSMDLQHQDLMKRVKEALSRIENMSERIKRLHPVTSRKFKRILKSIITKDN